MNVGMPFFLLFAAFLYSTPADADDAMDPSWCHLREILDSSNLAELGFGIRDAEVTWGLIEIKDAYGRLTSEQLRESDSFEYGRESQDAQIRSGGLLMRGQLSILAPETQGELEGEHLFCVCLHIYSYDTGTIAHPGVPPRHLFYSVFSEPNLILCPLQEDGWPAFHAHEENNFLVPEELRQDAMEIVRWVNHLVEVEDEKEKEDIAYELPDDNFYAIVSSVSVEDPTVWDRAWEGEGLLNACLMLRVADLGNENDTLGFTGAELIIARAEGVESIDELYWVTLVYHALRYSEPRHRMDVVTETNPIRRAIRDRFEQLKQEHPEPAESVYRARLQWMADEGYFNRLQTEEERIREALEERAE